MKRILFTILLLFAMVPSFSQTIRQSKIEDLVKYMEASEVPLVINCWATFCKPCVEEIPYFQSLVNNYAAQKVKLLLVSLDLPSYYPRKIAAFAKQHRFTADIIWLDETNADHFCPKIDTAWSGSIPATLFYNPKTGYRKFYEKELSREQFEAELKLLTR
jgi:thiol-disulfide isomerase/thioredoxin